MSACVWVYRGEGKGEARKHRLLRLPRFARELSSPRGPLPPAPARQHHHRNFHQLIKKRGGSLVKPSGWGTAEKASSQGRKAKSSSAAMCRVVFCFGPKTFLLEKLSPTLQVFKLTLFALWYLFFTSATVLPYNSIIRLGKPLRNRL